MPTTRLYDGDLYRPPPLFTLAAYFYSLLDAHAAIDYAVYGAVEARFALVIRHSLGSASRMQGAQCMVAARISCQGRIQGNGVTCVYPLGMVWYSRV